MTREKELFTNFSEFLDTFGVLNNKRQHSDKQGRQTALNALKFRNFISLAESDIYQFSIERSQLKASLRQLQIKHDQISNTYEERKEKFNIAAESMCYFTYRSEILLEKEEELKLV